MHIRHSFGNGFKTLMEKMYTKYGEDIFLIQGIANKHLDIVEFSKNFFGNSANVADSTVDGNANINEKNVIQYSYEKGKALDRLNSLYLIWKGVKKEFGEIEAEKCIDKIVSGEIFVNDLHLFQVPYSYYGKTTIIVRINGQIKYVTMENLLEMYSDKIEILPDREQVTFDTIQYSNKDYVRNNPKRVKSRDRKSHPKQVTTYTLPELVTESQIIEVLDKGKWVKLQRILRHKKDTDMIYYQTDSGRASLVTDNHPVILKDTSEIKAGDLKLGDKVICLKDIPVIEKTVSVDKDLAYLVGFMLGDGNSTRHRFYDKGRCNLSDKELAFEYDPVRGRNIIYQKNIRDSKIFPVLVRLFKEENLTVKENRVTFASLEFDILCKKYFGMIDRDNSFNKCLPSNILSWKESSVDSLICGLIDAEGTVIRDNTISIRMKAFAIIQQLQLLLELKGIHAGINYYEDIKCWGICFPIDTFINDSEKVSKVTVKEYKAQYDTRDTESCKVKKIVRIPREEEWNSHEGNHLEWVYDITTETGTFSSGLMTQHNCYAFDLTNLVLEGMNFFKGNMKIKAPKRSDSFIALVIQTTAYISNQISGAVSYPNFFLLLDWYYRKEFSEDYMLHPTDDMVKKIKNQFQNLIYSLNFPFRGNQSPFTNLSVLDKGFMDSLFKDFVFPDMTPLTEENKYSTIELSKLFFEYYSEINFKEGVFTFPVMTLAISVDENNNFIDEDFVHWVALSNSEKALANVFIDKPTSFSSCCFTGDTPVLVNNQAKIQLVTFKELYESSKDNLKTFHCGSWVKAKIVKTDTFDKELIRIVTSNNKLMEVTKDHIFPTIDGDKMAKDLTAEDYILTSSNPLDSFTEQDMHLTYNQGLLIGAYLRDGSSYVRTSCNSVSVTLSFNEDKVEKLGKILQNWNIYPQKNNVVSVVTSDKDIYSFIKDFVTEDYSSEKSLNLKCLAQSIEFRRGILDGYYFTDGGNNNRIYSTSLKLVKDMEALITSLGMASCIDVNDRCGDVRQFRDEKEFINCIRWYEPKNREFMKDVYKKKFNQFYYKVKRVDKFITTDESVYCFEINDKEVEKYFTLPSGIVTHNCRLRNDFKTLADSGYQNSFGVGGVQIGSHRVAGLNLPRLALMKEESFDEALECVHKVLLIHRLLIIERIKLGVLPLYDYGWISLKKQYSTIGFIGTYEYLINKGIDIVKVQDYGVAEIDKVLRKISDKAMEWQIAEKERGIDSIYNIEQIPAESMAVRLAQIDFKLGYNFEPGSVQKRFELYSNQYIPLIAEASIYDRFKIQGKIDSMTSGGAILHLNIDDSKGIEPYQLKRLIDTAQKTGTKYFAINYAFSKCINGHYFIGQNKCPICGEKIESSFTRVVGFLTNVKHWNKVRREFEFNKRIFYAHEAIQ